jgi:hypothetical protein
MELKEIAGGRKNLVTGQFCGALLLPGAENSHDPSTVTVYVDGKRVGYLHRDVAPGFKRALVGRNYVAAGCIAKIDLDDGHRGQFGVRLDAFMPFSLRDLEPDEAPPMVPSFPAGGTSVDIGAGSIDTVPLARRLRGSGRILMLLCACLTLGLIGAVGMASVNEYLQSTKAAQMLPLPQGGAEAFKEIQKKSEMPGTVVTMAAHTEVDEAASAPSAVAPDENAVAAYISPNLEIMPAATPSEPAGAPQTVRLGTTADVPLPRPRRPDTRQAAGGGMPDGLNELRQMFVPVPSDEAESLR